MFLMIVGNFKQSPLKNKQLFSKKGEGNEY
jgi:hypothetical protein